MSAFIVYAQTPGDFYHWAFDAHATIRYDSAADEARCVIGDVEYRAKLGDVA